MGHYNILVVLCLASLWPKVWPHSCEDPFIVKNIEEQIWEGTIPENILKNDASHDREVYLFGTRDFCPLTATASITTTLQNYTGLEYYVKAYESVEYDGYVLPPRIGVARENGDGTVTVFAGGETTLVRCILQYVNNGVSAVYLSTNKDGKCYTAGAIKVDWKKLRNRDILCQTINYFELSGLKLFLRKIFYIDWSRQCGFSKFVFDPDCCVGDEYVDDLKAVLAKLEADRQKKLAEEAARLAEAQEAARLLAEKEAAEKAAEIAALEKAAQDEAAAAEAERWKTRKTYAASTKAQYS